MAAEDLADRGRALGQRAIVRMAVIVAGGRQRSVRPRMFSVESALTWVPSGMPTIMPYCCMTPGSDIVGSIRPSSSGVPS